MKKIKKCRCCNKNNLLLYLDLGIQPLANSYHKGQILPEYPLRVLLCLSCYHSQLSIAVDSDKMFKDYLYVSGTTSTFRKHCKELAADAFERVSVTSEKKNVLDIACNDGTQLEFFRNLGCNIMGVDPAVNLRKITSEKHIPVVVDYWSTKTATNIKEKFDIITATNVFAHVDDLDDFLNAIKIVIKENGILILEFPYADKMIGDNEFDTVYHEHLSYFLVNSFKNLVERLNFHIVDVLQTSIHGGSIRFFLQNGIGKHSRKIGELISQEKEKGLLNKETYLKFSKRISRNKENMKILIKKILLNKEKIIGYGASAKGNTMLNYFKINLDYIVDDNSLKWGLNTPGRNIPIFSPLKIKSEKDRLNIMILSWNFYKEIIGKIKSIRRKNKDNFILYVPEVKIMN